MNKHRRILSLTAKRLNSNIAIRWINKILNYEKNKRNIDNIDNIENILNMQYLKLKLIIRRDKGNIIGKNSI